MASAAEESSDAFNHDQIIDPSETQTQEQVEPEVFGGGEENFYPVCRDEVVIPVVMEDVAEPRRYIHLRALVFSIFLWASIFFVIACQIPFISLFQNKCGGFFLYPDYCCFCYLYCLSY